MGTTKRSMALSEENERNFFVVLLLTFRTLDKILIIEGAAFSYQATSGQYCSLSFVPILYIRAYLHPHKYICTRYNVKYISLAFNLKKCERQ